MIRYVTTPCHAGPSESVAESPYYLRVLPGEPVPRMSSVEGDGCSVAIVGREAVFWVVVRDEFGNRHAHSCQVVALRHG